MKNVHLVYQSKLVMCGLCVFCGEVSLSDFECAWLSVTQQFDERRRWVAELDGQLTVLEDSRVNAVRHIISTSLV